jgi:NAD(P)-dependent dehydrogenase (short-subunit alcohol dehydrogenase family)
LLDNKEGAAAMDLKLRGKRALVTGSTQGIGFAIAQGLAREGAAVVVNGRGEDKVSDAVKRLVGATKASVIGIAGDVGNAAEVNRLVAQLGPVDILINMPASLSRSRFSTFQTAIGSAISRSMS